MKRLPFDKYDYYYRSVQAVDSTIDFIDRIYRKHYGRLPRSLSEDFCGTFALSCAWVWKGGDRSAMGVDLDPAPVRYGFEHYFPVLPPEDRKRLSIYQCDVRDTRLPCIDVIGSFNFSYFVFKRREDLLAYFRNCRRRLPAKGLLVLDCFGGTDVWEPNEEATPHGSFTYYWDQASFDPLTHDATFYIHFKRRGEPKRERVFRYDWRMWTIPELRDLLNEAGFEKVSVYWELTGRDGEGSGVFREKKRAENCPGWVVYLTAF